MAALHTGQLSCMLSCLVATDKVKALGAAAADHVPMALDNNTLHLLHDCGDRDGVVDVSGHVDAHTFRGAFILNTEPHNKPGAHWVGFIYNGPTRRLEYFDSYAMPLSFYADVHDALVRNKLAHLVVPVAKQCMQSVDSQVCGQYCVVFLMWRARNLDSSPHKFVAMVDGARRGSRDVFVDAWLKRQVDHSAQCKSQLDACCLCDPRSAEQTCHCRTI